MESKHIFDIQALLRKERVLFGAFFACDRAGCYGYTWTTEPIGRSKFGIVRIDEVNSGSFANSLTKVVGKAGKVCELFLTREVEIKKEFQ